MSVSPARATSFRPAGPSANAGAPAGLAIIQIVLIVSLPVLLQSADGQRAVIAMIIATLLYAAYNRSPSFGIPLTLSFSAIMMGLRRWLIPVFGYTHTDPFVLVTPALILLNFVGMLIQRQIPRDSLLSKLLLWLLIIMGVEVINPLQGGLAVGFGGLLLVAIPLLWYYLSRQTVSPKLMSNLYRLVMILSVLCALYGLYQQFVGFLPSELQYIKYSQYTQRLTNTIARVFSTLAGFSEYAKFMGCGAVIAFAYFLKKNRFALFVFVFLLGCVFLSSSRGELVNVLVTCMSLWSVQGISRRTWWPRLIVALIIGVGGLVWSLKQVQTTKVDSDNATSTLIAHQTQLLDPLAKNSTGGGHIGMQLSGVLVGFTHPFGLGIGSITLAAAQYGTATSSYNVEGDVGDAFVALGFVGGGIFLALFIVTYREAFLNWHYFRDLNSLCSLAILLVTVQQWLIGGDYTIVMLIWFNIGYVDLAGIERRRLIALADPPADSRLSAGARNRRNRLAPVSRNAA